MTALDCGNCSTTSYRTHFGITLQSGRPGTGMGLAICRRIARRHGGDVTMSDSDLATADSGLALVVRLPASGDEQLTVRSPATQLLQIVKQQ